MYIHGWFMWMYGKNHHNIVKSLIKSLQLKKNIYIYTHTHTYIYIYKEISLLELKKKKLPPTHLECSMSCSGISLPFIHGREFQISSRELMRFQISNLNVCWHVSEIFITLVGVKEWAFWGSKCFEHLFSVFVIWIFLFEHFCTWA